METKMLTSIYLLAMVLLISSFSVACYGGLTKTKAESAIYEWSRMVKGSGGNTGGEGTLAGPTDLIVTGIQEFPQENAAKVFLKFDEFKFKNGTLSYSGSGTATFSHFTDGRWVLSKVEMSDRSWTGEQVKNQGNDIIAK
ncbi:MAG: hypothetical protein AB7J13_13725 [Pyrinomonadaceae bacterium]